ncbi:hypothetical protein G7Y89_g899 [Cudoniella acicularis]|uniref:Uncharacterized protein n=1 Tax=Cudoniella acicularis TaxID=354080 RepID=A0A8H4W8F9_9HELO|nr:hypothetical protein G7Y89_g899 [Cudoniella acicularis]
MVTHAGHHLHEAETRSIISSYTPLPREFSIGPWAVDATLLLFAGKTKFSLPWTLDANHQRCQRKTGFCKCEAVATDQSPSGRSNGGQSWQPAVDGALRARSRTPGRQGKPDTAQRQIRYFLLAFALAEQPAGRANTARYGTHETRPIGPRRLSFVSPHRRGAVAMVIDQSSASKTLSASTIMSSPCRTKQRCSNHQQQQ